MLGGTAWVQQSHVLHTSTAEQCWTLSYCAVKIIKAVNQVNIITSVTDDYSIVSNRSQIIYSMMQ